MWAHSRFGSCKGLESCVETVCEDDSLQRLFFILDGFGGHFLNMIAYVTFSKYERIQRLTQSPRVVRAEHQCSVNVMMTILKMDSADASRVQSPRPETPEPASRQGRRNAQMDSQLFDDEGGISEKVRRPLRSELSF